MTFKMVDDRVILARRLETLIESHAETAAQALAGFFAEYSELPEELWLENELLRQRLLVRGVRKARRELVATAEATIAAQRSLDARLTEQGSAVTELHDRLVDARREARDRYGVEASTIFGVKGRTSRNSGPLAHQTRHALLCLATPATAGYFSGLDASCQAWSRELAPALAALDRVQTAVLQARSAKLLPVVRKQEALKRFDHVYGTVGRYVLATYRLVRLDELAAQVPPRTVRPEARDETLAVSPYGHSASESRPLAKVVEIGQFLGRRLRRLASRLGRHPA